MVHTIKTVGMHFCIEKTYERASESHFSSSIRVIVAFSYRRAWSGLSDTCFGTVCVSAFSLFWKVNNKNICFTSCWWNWYQKMCMMTRDVDSEVNPQKKKREIDWYMTYAVAVIEQYLQDKK